MVENTRAFLAMTAIIESALVRFYCHAKIPGAGKGVGQFLSGFDIQPADLGLVFASTPHTEANERSVQRNVRKADTHRLVGAHGVRIDEDLLHSRPAFAYIENGKVLIGAAL